MPTTASKDSQLNVRFDPATAADLKETADKLGTSTSALVRHLTRSFLRHVDKRGALDLEIDWDAILAPPRPKQLTPGERREGHTFIGAWVPDEMVAALDAEVRRQDSDRSKLLRQALADYFAKSAA